jgi:uncharacterized glyoxalase superfamily protein PhnB
MDITIHASFLPRNDRDASLAFYRDTLGFEVRNDVGYDGTHWITVGPAGQPGTSIVMATADLDGTFARLQASGAEVVQEPTEQPYGVRDCAVRDPAGSLIRTNELR